jgi:hypothetical protein
MKRRKIRIIPWSIAFPVLPFQGVWYRADRPVFVGTREPWMDAAAWVRYRLAQARVRGICYEQERTSIVMFSEKKVLEKGNERYRRDATDFIWCK